MTAMNYEGLRFSSLVERALGREKVGIPLGIPFDYFRKTPCNTFDLASRRKFGLRIRTLTRYHPFCSNVGVLPLD